MSEGSVFEGEDGGESEKISERALLEGDEGEGGIEGGVSAMTIGGMLEAGCRGSCAGQLTVGCETVVVQQEVLEDLSQGSELRLPGMLPDSSGKISKRDPHWSPLPIEPQKIFETSTSSHHRTAIFR